MLFLYAMNPVYMGAVSFGAKTAVGYGAKENHANEDEVLRGKGLAKAWQALEDEVLKQQALKDIRARWERHDWWDEPPGKAARQAKQIYEESIDSTP